MAWPGIGLVTLVVFFAATMVFAIVVGFKLRTAAQDESSAAPAPSAAAH